MRKKSLKKATILIVLLITFCRLSAQSNQPNPYGEKYHDRDLNALKIVNVIDTAGFMPIKLTTDLRQFKAAILQLSDRAYNQINIDTWSLCSYKHEEYFQIYNMYYKPVKRSYYDENCKALIALMLIDGTIKQPR